MASFEIILVFVTFFGIVITKIMAMEHVVGDDNGWRLGFDYQDWASGNQFRVGDKLIFKYPQGFHNVIKVDQNGFEACVAAPGDEKLTSGNDTVELNSVGTQFFICGIGKHCVIGPMKLSVDVLLE